MKYKEEEDEDVVYDMYGEPVGKKSKPDYASEAKESMSSQEMAEQVKEGYIEVTSKDEPALAKKATSGKATEEEVKALYKLRREGKAQVKAPKIKSSFTPSERKYSSGKSTSSDAKSSGSMATQVTQAIKRIKANTK